MAKENKTHPDLTNIDGTFSSVVEANSNRLSGLINDDSVGVDEIKDFCLEMMENCKDSPWIRKAKTRIERMTDKNELAFFIYNSMLSGANLKSIR